MGKIITHIANGSHYFTKVERGVIQNAVKAAEDYVSDVFDFDYEVDLFVTPPSCLPATIPEDGVGGRTYNSRLIVITLNKQQAEINEDMLFETICHEMSHSLRWEKLPVQATTMFDGMILEGLATVFEEKALSDTKCRTKQFFLKEIQNTTQEAIDTMLDHLRNDLLSEAYDYERIFFTGDEKLSRWAGYKLGYYFVKKYLDVYRFDVTRATIQSYSEFDLLI